MWVYKLRFGVIIFSPPLVFLSSSSVISLLWGKFLSTAVYKHLIWFQRWNNFDEGIFCDFSSSDWLQNILCFFNFWILWVAVLMGVQLLNLMGWCVSLGCCVDGCSVALLSCVAVFRFIANGCFNLYNGNNGLQWSFFLPLQDRHVRMVPEDEEAILALHFALPVGDGNLTKKAKFLKFWLWLHRLLAPLDLP